MAQAFDLAGRTNPSGCPPSFAQFAEGGNHDRIRNAVGAEGTKSCVGSIATRPCKKRKDGAPPAQMAHTSIVESRATRRPSGFILCSAHPAARFRSNVRCSATLARGCAGICQAQMHFPPGCHF